MDNSRNYEPEKGVALVLVGPEGCGKTTLAFEIAQQYGRVRSLCGGEMADSAKLRAVLNDHPDVLIVDGLTYRDIGIAKTLLVEKLIDCATERLDVVLRTKTPTYIICTGSPNVLSLHNDDRRFRVVDLGEQPRSRDEIKAENRELRELLVAAYRELQRHGVESVPLGDMNVRPPRPNDLPRCRYVAAPVEPDIGMSARRVANVYRAMITELAPCGD